MAKSARHKPPTVALVSLGCFKNTVDSEVLAGLLGKHGMLLVSEHEPVDWLVINTCGFIRDAKEESEEEILRALERKEKGEVGRVAVFGCLPQRYAAELPSLFPAVDLFWGVNDIETLASAIATGRTRPYRDPGLFLYTDRHPRQPITLPNTSFMKISEGCNMRCSFCAIPSIRGSFRSRASDSLLREAEGLRRRGVEELNLVSQNSTYFGRDRGEQDALPDLLRSLAGIGFRWLRLLYMMPEELDDRILQAFQLPTVLPYFDLPFQHVSAALLRRMKRSGNARTKLSLISRIRATIPGAVLRASFIVGFPGERERDFEELLDFAAASAIERIGVFAYSDEEGTASFDLPGKIDPALIAERRERLLDVSDQNLKRYNRRLHRSVQEFLPQGPWSNQTTVGRIASQAPEVDGWTEVAAPFDGDWGVRRIRVTGSQNQILRGEFI